MEKTIQVLINNWVKGADTYTYNGSSWLIFTDNKQWVVELTESKTLWYNYNFFKQIFEFISLDVVDNQHHITKWVEDNVINGVNRIDPVEHTRNSMTKHLIKYGVKETYLSNNSISKGVEHIIKNGVKDTYLLSTNLLPKGVKETNHVDVMWFFDKKMEETLQNGVKSSDPRQYVGGDIIDNVIDKGIIETHGEICEYKHTVEHIIQTGVKETYNDFYHHKGRIDGVIKNGVKQTIDCDWSEPNQIDEVIEASVMKTESRLGIRKHSVGATIKYGIKETKGDSSQNPMGKVNKVIKNGVKETKVCNYTDPKTQLMWVKWGNQIEEVIGCGVKVSGTFVGGKRQKEDVEYVIGYGTKTPTN
jgi:hypothetical protein